MNRIEEDYEEEKPIIKDQMIEDILYGYFNFHF